MDLIGSDKLEKAGEELIGKLQEVLRGLLAEGLAAVDGREIHIKLWVEDKPKNG